MRQRFAAAQGIVRYRWDPVDLTLALLGVGSLAGLLVLVTC